jgi:maltose O-acetyltransferase
MGHQGDQGHPGHQSGQGGQGGQGGQKGRMLRGELYLADDPELLADYAWCQRLLREFNATGNEDPAGRRVLEELLGELGPGATIRSPFHCDYGRHIRVGAGSFINYATIILDCAPVTIGADVQIGPGVQLLTATHPLDAATRRSRLESANPITVADGAWLGGGAIVCPGVTIGAEAVVGAGSVVTRDLPPWVLAVGNPCRVVRELPG